MNGDAETDEVAVVPVVHHDRPETMTRQVMVPAGKFNPLPTQADDDAEKDRERAFDAGYAWNGEELIPFAIGRKSLFLQQRLAMGAPPILDAWRDFDAFLGDAMRILFLCSTADAVLVPLRRDPMLLQGAIDAWAQKNITPKQEAAATAMGIRIYADSCVNEHEAEPSSHRDDDSGN